MLPSIRWIYPIVGGVIAESVTIALTALVVALTGHGTANDPVAQRIGAIAGATVGSLMCFVAGWWAARHAGDRFELHGVLTGAAAGVLTALGAVFGPSGQAVYYLVAVLMKLFAGRAGGRMAASLTPGGS